jgi:RNA polymerase sigma factor (sigma-70 family)
VPDRRINPTPLTEDRRDLAGRHLPMARTLARDLARRFPRWADDFESAAGLALVEAARSYDPASGAKFGGFARSHIHGRMIDVLRRQVPMGFRHRGRRKAAPAIRTLSPGLPSPGTSPEAATDELDAFERRIAGLPRKYRDVVRPYYRDGLTEAEIAALLGLSQAGVSRRRRLALELLRAAACPWVFPEPPS